MLEVCTFSLHSLLISMVFSTSKGSAPYYPTDAFVDGRLSDYKWIVVLGCFGAMYTAWGIGANDLANSFGTTVGSKTLKIWQVLIIASIFEFLGAFFLGSTVTDTISSKIANIVAFANRPELYMFGMMMVDYSSALWLNVATALELPVSTTHSTIGAVIGFSLVVGGRHGVIWNEKIGDFPYRKGLTPIIISWFTSPIIAAVFSGCLYFIIRTVILRRRNSFKIACFLVPVLFFGLVMVNVVYVISKGAKFLIDKDNIPYKDKCKAWINDRTIGQNANNKYGYEFAARCIKEQVVMNKYFAVPSKVTGSKGDKWSGIVPNNATAPQIYNNYKVSYPSNVLGHCCRKVNVFTAKGWPNQAAAAALAAGLACILAILYIWLYIAPKIRRNFAAQAERDEQKARDLEVAKTDSEYADKKAEDSSDKDSQSEAPLPSFKEDPKGFVKQASMKALRKVFAGAFYDIHEVAVNENHKDFDPRAKMMHDMLERYDPMTEKLFEYLQVFSACAMSFAHGANDVANAIGPFTGVWSVYKFRRINPSSVDLGDDVKWILGLGGASIVVGLATYGHYIMRALGVKLASITPSRGFCMETCTSITITFASAYGLPVSTTHCQVGSTSGTGFVDSPRYGVNWPFLLKMFIGWVFTLICAGVVSAALFSFGAYAPNVYMVTDRESYQKYIGTAMSTLLKGALAKNGTVTATQLSAAGFATQADWIAHIQKTQMTNDRLNSDRIDKINKVTRAITYSSNQAKPFRLVQYFYAADQNVVLENVVKAVKPYFS